MEEGGLLGRQLRVRYIFLLLWPNLVVVDEVGVVQLQVVVSQSGEEGLDSPIPSP